MSSFRLVIHGQVQGVFFRDSMRTEAQRLGITGWVRNRRDGAVEAVVQGEEKSVEEIIRWAQHGPQWARVEKVDLSPEHGSYLRFEILP